MKILSHEIKGDMIHIHTDDKDMSDFVYEADRFGSKAELVREIEAKLASINRKKNKIAKLESELNA